MAMVIVKKDESIEQALKRFKKQMIKDDILGEYKRRQYYISKGQKNRMAKEAAIRKNKINQNKYNNKKDY